MPFRQVVGYSPNRVLYKYKGDAHIYDGYQQPLIYEPKQRTKGEPRFFLGQVVSP